MIVEVAESLLKRFKGPERPFDADAYIRALDERIEQFKKIETDLAFRTYERNIDYR